MVGSSRRSSKFIDSGVGWGSASGTFERKEKIRTLEPNGSTWYLYTMGQGRTSGKIIF